MIDKIRLYLEKRKRKKREHYCQSIEYKKFIEEIISNMDFKSIVISPEDGVRLHDESMFMDLDSLHYWIQSEQLFGFIEHHYVGERRYLLSEVHGVTSARDKSYKNLYDYSLSMKLNTREEDFQYTWVETHEKNMHKHVMFVLDWSKKTYLSVDDGSHRLAASHRQDKREGRNTSFHVRTTIIHINKKATSYFANQYHILVLEPSNANEIVNLLEHLGIEVFYNYIPHSYHVDNRPNLLKYDQRTKNRYHKTLWFHRNVCSNKIVEMIEKYALPNEYMNVSNYLI